MQAVKIGWVGQTFAMARCSEANTKGRKPRSRIKKEERKSMIESFIHKYRQENKGNFPSLNLTHKEVGGSFYTVREIVRELIQENRVLAPGSSQSQVLNLEYCEDRVQAPLGTLSLDPASDFAVEVNGHDAYETGGGQIDRLRVIEESEKIDDKTCTISSNLTASEDMVTSLHEFSENKDMVLPGHEDSSLFESEKFDDKTLAFSSKLTASEDTVTSLHEFSENKNVVLTAHEESSISDANFAIDSMQAVILESDHCKPKNQLDSLHDVSSTKKTGTVVVEQLAVLASASGSSLSDSICVGEGEDSLVTESTKVASFMGLKESNSAEISTLQNREPTYINKGDVKDLQDVLSKSGVPEDHLSSFNSSSYIDSECELEFEDVGKLSSTYFKIESSSFTEEKRTNLLETMPPLPLDEISQVHSCSSNITVEEVGANIGVSVSDISYNHPPHTDNEVESLHFPVDDTLKNPIAASETTEQLDPPIESEILHESKSPSSVKADGSSMLEAVESDLSTGPTLGSDVAKETNPFVAALKGFLRAFVKFLTAEF